MPQRQDIVDKAFDCNEVDWNEYESHRPPYTKDLYDLLFRHHEAYGGQCDTALDVGAGGGTVTRVLLEKFKHVILSDPSMEYLSRAQKRFSQEADAGRVSFLQRKFHEFNREEDLPAGGDLIDMITAGTCIHYGDSAKVMAQLAPLLRPGGTVAAFSYGSVPVLPSHDPAGPLVKKCKDKIMRWIHENVYPLDEPVDGTGTGQSRFKNIDFDPATWKNVRRITSLPEEHIWPEWIPSATSRVRDGESSEVVHDDCISKEVDYEFFPTYFSNFAPQLPILDQIPEELAELKTAMGDRRVVAKWPLVMALATKM